VEASTTLKCNVEQGHALPTLVDPPDQLHPAAAGEDSDEHHCAEGESVTHDVDRPEFDRSLREPPPNASSKIW
jgi:hypothetical protein